MAVTHQDVNVFDIPTPPRQQGALFIIFFFTAIGLVVYCLRAYTRLKTRQWGMDDWMVTGAMVFSLAMITPFYMYIKLNYFGWTVDAVPQFDPTQGKRWFYFAQLFYNPILALAKASVLCFLLRLGGQKPGVKYVVYGLNAFNGLQALATFFTTMVACLPISANWDTEVLMDPNTKCVNLPVFYITTAALTIFTDIFVVALPFWIFLGLKMPMAAKVAVVGIFMLGFCVTIISIVRLVNLYKLFYIPPAADPYRDIGITLSVVEANLAIISASAPALRPLFRSLLPSLFGGSSGRYELNQYNPHAGSRSAKLTTAKGTSAGASAAAADDGMLSVNRHSSIRLKGLRNGNGKNGHTECRSVSPSGSEEEIMTYNGIMRTTDVHVHFGHSDERMSRASSDLKTTGDAEKGGV